jgi:hypothetical protein
MGALREAMIPNLSCIGQVSQILAALLDRG